MEKEYFIKKKTYKEQVKKIFCELRHQLYLIKKYGGRKWLELIITLRMEL